jgi:ABC-type polysaccharide/polyol phosphate export permease
MPQETSALPASLPPKVYDSDRRPHPFVEEWVELYRYRDLVSLWTVRNLTLRYKRSVLGVLWTLLEPLMLMIILTIVFSQLFRFSVPNYPIYVLSGLLLFDFFSRSTIQMVDEIIASQNLAQRIHLPRSSFAMASILSYLANWAIALVPLVAIMLILRHEFSWALLAVPAAMGLTALFALGVGLVVATLGVHFHDFKITYNVLLSAWFYATPIIYPLEIIPEAGQKLFALNPIVHLLALFRSPIYEGRFPSAAEWLIGAALAFGLGGTGWWIFTRWRKAFDYRI